MEKNRFMKLELKRTFFAEKYTIGKLSIDGVLFCDTLEDKNRDLNKDGDLKDNGETKVFGETAIPFGTYEIIMNESQRFKRKMPLLLSVPSFAGIRIHAGSKAEHSHGCILVGKNTIKGGLTDSKAFEVKLYALLNKAFDNKEKIEIEIK
jgi:hypothetical protein